MSSDNTSKVEKRKNTSVEEHKVTVDSVTDSILTTKTIDPKKIAEARKDELPARRKHSNAHRSVDYMAQYHRYIPEGYVGRFEDPSMNQCEINLENDWIFAQDEEGKRIYMTANRGSDAEKNRFPLMIKRKEYVEEDALATAKLAHNRLRGHSKEANRGVENISGVGYYKDKF